MPWSWFLRQIVESTNMTNRTILPVLLNLAGSMKSETGELLRWESYLWSPLFSMSPAGFRQQGGQHWSPDRFIGVWWRIRPLVPLKILFENNASMHELVFFVASSSSRCVQRGYPAEVPREAIYLTLSPMKPNPFWNVVHMVPWKLFSKSLGGALLVFLQS